MSYAQYGLVQASDFDTLVGGNPTTTANTLNTVWATGGSAAGYGQTPLANVNIGDTVTASPYWSSLVNDIANIASHQGTTILNVTSPASGNTVTYLSAIPTNMAAIYTNRLNAAVQGITSSVPVTYGTSWSNGLTFTFNVTFATGDAARYFFNAGGQINFTAFHPSGTGINLLFNNLATDIGTVSVSSPASGSATIAGNVFNGVTQFNGSGNSPTISPNSGYYGLISSNTTVFTQTASTGPSSYLGSNISIVAKTNGSQGANGDNGSVLTFYVTWNEVPTGLTASAGSATTMTVIAPETGHLSNSWGTPSITGTVTGS